MNKNIYMSKGYYPISLITESKKAKDIQVVFLSSRAEKTTKSSNSMFFFEDAAKKAGLKMIVIDPSSSNISKGANGNFTVVENGSSKKTYILNPNNTIIVPRRTVLKNIESRDFLSDLQKYDFFTLNTLEAIDNCEDKFITYKKLSAANVPTPKTAVVTHSSMSKLDDKVKSVGGSFPLIVKITKGTQGIGVAQIDSMISLKSVLQAIFALVPKADILLQEKIDSDFDLRIHVLYKGFERMTPGIENYEVIGCMQRNQLEGDFRSNYSLGSTAEKGHLTKEQEDIAKKAKYLVLQPQSEVPEMREYLVTNGYNILKNKLMIEKDKYYFAILASATVSECGEEKSRVVKGLRERKSEPEFEMYSKFMDELFGLDLIYEDKNFAYYLSHVIREWGDALTNLSEAKKPDLDRINELKTKKVCAEVALELNTLFCGIDDKLKNMMDGEFIRKLNEE